MAFHPYPQLIQRLFNVNWFGPPCRVTDTSTWSWVDHKVSRLQPLTSFALFRLAFASAPYLQYLTWPVTATRRVIMQKARRHSITELRPLVSVRFQGLFTPLFGVLFTFPSRYSFTIGLSGVFSLGGWCRRIQRGFHRSPPTQDPATLLTFTSTGLSPAMADLPRSFDFNQLLKSSPTTPIPP